LELVIFTIHVYVRYFDMPTLKHFHIFATHGTSLDTQSGQTVNFADSLKTEAESIQPSILIHRPPNGCMTSYNFIPKCPKYMVLQDANKQRVSIFFTKIDFDSDLSKRWRV
jgi:hypothetical protein